MVKVLNMSKDIYCDSLEFECLKNGDIAQVADLLNSMHSGKNMSVLGVGHLIPSILERSDFHSLQVVLPHEFSCLDSEVYDTVICTNPVLTKLVLEDDIELEQFTRKVRRSFTFLLPLFSDSKDGIEVLWNKGFSDIEEENGEYSCWFADDQNHDAVITLYNHTNSPYLARIKFHLYSLDPNSIVSINLMESKFVQHNQGFYVDEEFYVYPGINQIVINHHGFYLDKTEGDIRPLRFKISGLSLNYKQSGGSENVISGVTAYKSRVSSNFYEFCLKPQYVKSRLHSNGFFEVKSYISIIDRAIHQYQTTRHFVNDKRFRTVSDNKRSFETVNSNGTALLIVNASRTGVLDV